MTWAEFKRQAEALGVSNDPGVVLLEGWPLRADFLP